MSEVPGWRRCAAVAEEAGDALVGTAPPAQAWFLLEHPGPWGPGGFVDSGVHPEAVAALRGWSAAAAGRVLLVRRPGRRVGSPATGRRWFRVDSRPGTESVRTGVVANDRDLVPVLNGTDDAAGAPVDDLVLVCAHGRHDTCCAVRGRPLADALVRAAPDAVWESSHLGGCRFAPSMVLLPHGFVLGHVPSAAAADVLAGYRAGRIDDRWLRGRSSLPAPAQVAQHAIRARTGVDAVDRPELVDVTDGPAGWRVRFTDPDVTVRLTERVVDTGRPLTCRAAGSGRLRVFDVDDLGGIGVSGA